MAFIIPLMFGLMVCSVPNSLATPTSTGDDETSRRGSSEFLREEEGLLRNNGGIMEGLKNASRREGRQMACMGFCDFNTACDCSSNADCMLMNGMKCGTCSPIGDRMLCGTMVPDPDEQTAQDIGDIADTVGDILGFIGGLFGR